MKLFEIVVLAIALTSQGVRRTTAVVGREGVLTDVNETDDLSLEEQVKALKQKLTESNTKLEEMINKYEGDVVEGAGEAEDEDESVASLLQEEDEAEEEKSKDENFPKTVIAERGDEEPWALKLEKARPRAPAAARPAPVDDTPRRVYVKGFPDSYNKEELVELFQDYGEVQSVKLRKKGKRGGPFAHLVFKTRDEAVGAVEQRNGYEVETEEVDEEGNKYVLVVEESRPRSRPAGGKKRRNRRPRTNPGTDDAAAADDAGPAAAATAATADDAATEE